jgi:hypothetical protein
MLRWLRNSVFPIKMLLERRHRTRVDQHLTRGKSTDHTNPRVLPAQYCPGMGIHWTDGGDSRRVGDFIQ